MADGHCNFIKIHIFNSFHGLCFVIEICEMTILHICLFFKEWTLVNMLRSFYFIDMKETPQTVTFRRKLPTNNDKEWTPPHKQWL